jgi:hypothetical protein
VYCNSYCPSEYGQLRTPPAQTAMKWRSCERQKEITRNKVTSKADLRQTKIPIVFLLASSGFQFNLAPFGAAVFSAHLYPPTLEVGVLRSFLLILKIKNRITKINNTALL